MSKLLNLIHTPRLSILPFAFLLLAFAATATAQTATATLSGTVVDANGAIVPGASVTLTDTGKGFERKVTTDSNGSFTLPLLQPSNYTLTVAREGFASAQVENVILNVADQRALRVELKISPIKDEVIVTPDASLVSTSPSVSTTIDRTFVGNLPLNGRSFQSLILLTPGVTVVSTLTSGDLGQFSVNGQRASSNYFTVDGVSANIGIDTITGSRATSSLGGAYPGTTAFGGTNNLVSVDALQEFKIQTSTYSAEFGRQPGGQVQLSTRSGENTFHGSLFEYLRNEVLDARDYFNFKPAPQTPLRQNHFGATFSGPVFLPNIGDGGSRWYNGKDRTFFFFSYEGQRLLTPTTGLRFVPSQRLRSAAAAAGSGVLPILNSFPLPTGPETHTMTSCPQPPEPPDPRCDPTTNTLFSGWSTYNLNVSTPSTLDATSIRIDHTINGKLALFGRFNEAPSKSVNTATGTFSSTRTLTLGATSVFTPKFTNELRFNYSRQLGSQNNTPATRGGAVPVDPRLLTNGLGGQGSAFLFFGGNFAVQTAGDFSKNYQRQINLVDNFSFVTAGHNIKFGIDYRQLSPTFAPLDQVAFGFSSETSVVNSIANSFTIFRNDGAQLAFVNLSLYGQDTWKLSRRLTLDLGFRWEINPAPTVEDGELPASVLNVSIGADGVPDVSDATLAPRGTPLYRTYYGALAPRFGAAYQIRTKQGYETVLRGGFGVYYDLNSAGAAGGYPFIASKSLANVPFPVPAELAVRPPTVIPTSLPVTTQLFANNRDLELPYSFQWNLGVEQSLGAHQSFSVSYVASAGRRLLTGQRLNRPIGLLSGPRPNPNFADIIFMWNEPTSDYNSLQTQYRARFTNGFQALANYTWSHAIDEVSTAFGTGGLSRGSADFDVRHNFSAAFTYALPKLGGAGSGDLPFGTLLKAILNGWTVDGIVHAQSGQPLNVVGSTTIVDGMLVSVRPNVVPGQPFYIEDSNVPGGRRFNPAAFTNPPSDPNFPTLLQQGNFGRNVLRQLPLYQFDLALGRRLNVTERVKLQLKAEVFNVFNHPMFGSYDTSYLSPATFGVPRFTLGRSLGGLNRLYQIGGPRSIQLSLRVTF